MTNSSINTSAPGLPLGVEDVDNNNAAGPHDQESGTVGIVYVDQSLYPGFAPRINETYRIVKAWSAEETPQLGAQLRRRYGERTFLCGWVKKDDNSVILEHLNSPNKQIYGKVTETEPFWWQGVQCYWGKMDWWVRDLTDEESN